MNSTRTRLIVRAVIVTMTLVGWFVLSNHCALGGMAPPGPVQKEHACCHNSAAKPASPPTPAHREQGAECCKSVHALLPTSAKAGDLVPPTLFLAILSPLVPQLIQVERAATIAGDIGPPRGRSFSELVLHRSLRSHAPPFIA